jgi:hypothetical protein
VTHAEKAECSHPPENLARDLAVALPLLATGDDLLLDKAADLLAQHPQFLWQIRLLREMELGIGQIAPVGGKSVHCGLLSAFNCRCCLRNSAIEATAWRASGSSANI